MIFIKMKVLLIKKVDILVKKTYNGLNQWLRVVIFLKNICKANL